MADLLSMAADCEAAGSDVRPTKQNTARHAKRGTDGNFFSKTIMLHLLEIVATLEGWATGIAASVRREYTAARDLGGVVVVISQVELFSLYRGLSIREFRGCHEE
jgi:hypothetical protein